jgi:hypothetical protein
VAAAKIANARLADQVPDCSGLRQTLVFSGLNLHATSFWHMAQGLLIEKHWRGGQRRFELLETVAEAPSLLHRRKCELLARLVSLLPARVTP